MLIGAVIGKEDQITPIVEGEILRLYDMQTKDYKDYHNPALHVAEGRRGAALTFALHHGAKGFVSPPETFCELSYEKAKMKGIQFLNIGANTTFQEFEQYLENSLIHWTGTLPKEEIVSSFPVNK